ncbi:hypothetical protein A9Q74_03995 [Colwellia sp. 39_35_sub15_T18]|nr:hypothetical protein A9Q74_03995 [Colwellia sp. 39_35_sub15_T18]
MNVRYSAPMLLGVAVFLSTNVIAQKIAIYRWVDENNIVHFSQNQPMGDNYSQLTTVSSYNPNSKKIIAESSNAENSAKAEEHELAVKLEEEQQKTIAKNKDIYAKNCNAAQLNIKMLNSFNRILYTDTDGESKVLSTEEKQEKLDTSKKHIDLYCEK